MTDISKYKNITLTHKAYNKAERLSNKLCDVKISKSKVVEAGINILELLVEKNLLSSLKSLPLEELKQRIDNNANPNLN